MSLPVVHLVAAARPNFMKVAPLWHTLAPAGWCRPLVVHTGQHHDAQMSDVFFQDLALPTPDIHLGATGTTHAEQTAAVLSSYEKALLTARPDWVVVVGDVNSTLACALAARKLNIPVAHLEAGLRSGDRTMPEEINRVATDAIADLHWTPSLDADENLRREGVDAHRIVRVGNIMIDAFERTRERIEKERTAERLGLPVGGYAVATFHRPVNVDSAEALGELVSQLEAASLRLPIAFPVHPRTRDRLRRFGLEARLAQAPGIRLLPPLGYAEFMSLVTTARLVLSDSGGVQEETTYLGIACLTVRESTERPITISEGTNRLVPRHAIADAVDRTLADPPAPRGPPALWDGRTALRAAASLREVMRA